MLQAWQPAKTKLPRSPQNKKKPKPIEHNETMNTQKHYIARWHDPMNLATIANVSFIARSEKQAHQKAKKIAVEIGLPNTPYTLN